MRGARRGRGGGSRRGFLTNGGGAGRIMLTAPDDGDELVILERLVATKGQLKLSYPADMEPLANEVRIVFRRCSIPESTNTHSEKVYNKIMAKAISIVHYEIVSPAEPGPNSGALVKLWYGRVATPENLEALLRMADARNRTGYIRCYATVMLCSLPASDESIWRLKLPADGSRFAGKLVGCLSQWLHDDVNFESNRHLHDYGENERTGSCLCSDDLWLILNSAVACTKETPARTIGRIAGVDWPSIFRQPGAPSGMGVALFNALHMLLAGYLTDHPDNVQARECIVTLGHSHEVFRRFLERIISGEHWALYESNLQNFLRAAARVTAGFLNCLVPPPDDDETYALVRRARAVCEVKFKIGTENRHDQLTDTLTGEIHDAEMRLCGKYYSVVDTLLGEDGWEKLKHETDEDRFERLVRLTREFMLPIAEMKSLHRQVAKQKLKSDYSLELTIDETDWDNEICGNCLKTERDIDGPAAAAAAAAAAVADGDHDHHAVHSGGGHDSVNCESNDTANSNSSSRTKFMKCRACKRISYCSRECQREHWYKCHRDQCHRKSASST